MNGIAITQLFRIVNSRSDSRAVLFQQCFLGWIQSVGQLSIVKVIMSQHAIGPSCICALGICLRECFDSEGLLPEIVATVETGSQRYLCILFESQGIIFAVVAYHSRITAGPFQCGLVAIERHAAIEVCVLFDVLAIADRQFLGLYLIGQLILRM